MKTTKRLIPIMLSLVFVVSSFMTVSALAALPGTQDGVEATLSCDKSEYSAGENVAVTLSVKNNNPYSVEGIETEIVLPDGFKIESGDLKQAAFALNADESREVSVTVTKLPEKPSATETPKSEDNSSGNTSGSDVPATDDTSSIGVYAVIMLLSGGALVALASREKRLRKKGMLSLVLCLMAVGAMLAPSAANAAGASKSFCVENTFKYDGKDVTVTANISYLYEKHYKVTFNETDTYYAVGDTVEITAPEAPEGQHFTGWTVVTNNVTLAEPTQASTTFAMPEGDVELEAGYAVNTYTITSSVNHSGMGTITESGSVNYDGSKTFTITPNDGYHIKEVLVDDVSKEAITSYTFSNVKETHTIEASFAADDGVEYYLAGYINNREYNELNEAFKFSNGSLTVEFTSDSYVIIKDSKETGYYTRGWIGTGAYSTVLGEFGSDYNNSFPIQAGKYTIAWDPNDFRITVSQVPSA